MTQLRRKLNLYGLTMIAVGSCIGSGIFITPANVVAEIPHPTLSLSIWVVGGLIALTGALTFSELGGMFPKAGGVYVFLKEAYGDLAGFLYGWVILLVINTGALAALAIAFADYMHFFVPGMTGSTRLILAAGTIAGLTAINCVGVEISQALTNVFTGIKLLAIVGIIIAGFVFYDPEKVNLSFSLSESLPPNWISGMFVGLIAVLWSFGGWHHATYLAGETINPQKTVARAMVLGAAIVTFTYVLVNLSYMLLLPLPAMAGSDRVAGDAMAAIVPWGGRLVAVAIAISIFGTIGIYTMSAPRIYFAMAQDKLFFSALAKVHPRFQTPVNAMVLQAIWAICLLFMWGTYSNLFTYVTFMDIIFMTMAGVCIFLFRKRMPDRERPYRTWGYPVVPGIFVLISGAFVLNTLVERPTQALAGLVLVGLGIVSYWLLKKRQP
ncbi:MAG: amino acid permease [Saprospirales bacterium]|nr:amino acid permease [Saprospirales bacterium]